MTRPTFENPTWVEVPARGPAVWTKALDYVSGFSRVRITANPDHRWTCNGVVCSPGGTFERSAAALLPFAPLGALVAKVGGGDAECPAPPASAGGTYTPPSGSKLVAVGTYCIIDITAAEGGPLYLAMNAEVTPSANHAGQLKVLIEIAVG